MFELARADRVFDNFLELQDRRIDSAEGLSASDRRLKISTLRRNRRARRTAADEAWYKFEESKDNGFSGSFLDWLLENSDSIFALIMKIIALFGL